MRTVSRMLLRQVAQTTAIVTLGFVALFIFLDLLDELQSVKGGSYQIQHAVAFVLLHAVRQVYDVLPIATLIGAVYTFALWARTSEFVILRASGLSPWQAIGMLLRTGGLLLLLLLVVGEWIAPWASATADTIKRRFKSETYQQHLSTGAWVRDNQNDADGRLTINVQRLRPGGVYEGWTIYRFSNTNQLLERIEALRGEQQGEDQWLLYDVTRQEMPQQSGEPIRTAHEDVWMLRTNISPALLDAVFRDPDYMSLPDLVRYVIYLRNNQQDDRGYLAAVWRKLAYPLSVVVMLLLALPFAYVQPRRDDMSLRVFIGVMIGISFILANQIVTNLGLLRAWPPALIAVLPTLLYLLAALGAITWVGVRR